VQQWKNSGQLSSFAHLQVPLAQRLLSLESQRLPQLPQLLKSVARFLQLPLQHVWPLAHTAPQPPQLASSLFTSTHAPLQQAWPVPQLELVVQIQRPPLHVRLLAHAVPHAPQLEFVVFRLVSQPLSARPSQLPNPALHVPT
jgi:hypothetical protein